MPTSLKVSVHSPCHENWQQMTPTEQGRHCNACAKEVVDFTNMTDAQVLSYFTTQKQQSTCGRFYADQLNREIKKPQYLQKKNWYWNILVMILMLFKGNNAKAQVQPPAIVQLSTRDEDKPLANVVGQTTVTKNKKVNVTGNITSSGGDAVPFATILIQGTKLGTKADANGAYSLAGVVAGDVLIVSAVGHETKKVKVTATGKIDCVLNYMIQGDVMVVVTGGFSSDYTPAPAPKHVAVIEVKDNASHLSLNATVKVEDAYTLKENTTVTNKKGIYKLRGIEETGNYTITVSAPGYKDTVFQISGMKFTQRKEKKYVFLQKEEEQLNPDTERRIIVGGASSITNQDPLYIIDGEISSYKNVMKLNVNDIESIDVLKESAAAALYGSQGTAGVIIITTKKKPVVKDAVVKQEDKISKQSVAVTLLDAVRVFPNPVQQGSSFTVSFNTSVISEAVIKVNNLQGVSVLTKKVVLTGKDNVIRLQADANWTTGVYAITVYDAGGNIIRNGTFIVL